MPVAYNSDPSGCGGREHAAAEGIKVAVSFNKLTQVPDLEMGVRLLLGFGSHHGGG